MPCPGPDSPPGWGSPGASSAAGNGTGLTKRGVSREAEGPALESRGQGKGHVRVGRGRVEPSATLWESPEGLRGQSAPPLERQRALLLPYINGVALDPARVRFGMNLNGRGLAAASDRRALAGVRA